MNNLKCSININSKKVSFELSEEYINNLSITNTTFFYFLIDFKSNYTPYYSLASIMGFDYFKNSNYYTSIQSSTDKSKNNKITSPYTFSNQGTTELFFCFDEYQSNIIETHKLFLNNNMSTHKILAKITSTLGSSNTNYYINETFSTNNDRFDIVRKYDGVINLLNFNIKIIDYYGNIVNENINENFTFTLEVTINQTRLNQTLFPQ